MLHLNQCNFLLNEAISYGGVFLIQESIVTTIYESNFTNNKAGQNGGVGYFSSCAVTSAHNLFCHNRAGKNAGALYLYGANLTISSGTFHNNTAISTGGSLDIRHSSKILLTGMITFQHNSAQFSAVINVYDAEIVSNGSLIIRDNNGSIGTAHSTVHFAGNMTFIDNKLSLYFFDSEVVISGWLNSTQHSHFKNLMRDFTLEGGSLTLFISRISITGNVILSNNSATNGGGMLSITSRIFVHRNGKLSIINNTAEDTGGGMYLYHSELYVQGPILVYGNDANNFGGGIHCISSTIVIIVSRHRGRVILQHNYANSGGGICLEANSKFYTKSVSGKPNAVSYIENRAKFGGAIFVADNTTSGTCDSGNVQSVTAASQSEWFIQILQPITSVGNYPHIGNVFIFQNNFAKKGKKLYGGLLDRCTVNAFGRNIHYTNIPNSVKSILSGTTSDPVRICLCHPNRNAVNCSYVPKIKHFRKGRSSNLTLRLAAVDHVNHTVRAVIHSSLYSRRGHLRDSQQAQYVNAKCADLNFSIISPLNYSDILYLYANRPCSSLGISSLKIVVKFSPCYCPTGFEVVLTVIDNCICSCHRVLKSIFPFLRDSDCNSETFWLTRRNNFWLTVINYNLTGYTTFLSYKYCPSAYCHPSTSESPVHIDLNSPNGPDVQCAFNHTGVLCGSCQSDLTLSLGSSRCISCPSL